MRRGKIPEKRCEKRKLVVADWWLRDRWLSGVYSAAVAVVILSASPTHRVTQESESRLMKREVRFYSLGVKSHMKDRLFLLSKWLEIYRIMTREGTALGGALTTCLQHGNHLETQRHRSGLVPNILMRSPRLLAFLPSLTGLVYTTGEWRPGYWQQIAWIFITRSIFLLLPRRLNQMALLNIHLTRRGLKVGWLASLSDWLLSPSDWEL